MQQAIRHFNPIVYAVIIAFVLTLLEHIDTFGGYFLQTIIVTASLKFLLSLWWFNPQEKNSTQDNQIDAIETLSEPQTAQAMPQGSGNLSDEFQLLTTEETVPFEAETSVEIAGTELEDTTPTFQEKPFATLSDESDKPGLEEMQKLLKGFSPRQTWRQLCQYLRDKEKLTLQGYSRLSGVRTRATFLVNSGVNRLMMERARKAVLFPQAQ